MRMDGRRWAYACLLIEWYGGAMGLREDDRKHWGQFTGFSQKGKPSDVNYSRYPSRKVC
jgi:hypothetical protein